MCFCVEMSDMECVLLIMEYTTSEQEIIINIGGFVVIMNERSVLKDVSQYKQR